MQIRDEIAEDGAAISALVTAAFAEAEHSDGTEAAIVDALRDAGALTLSLVATEGDEIVGHVAFSPVEIAGVEGWYGLGPVATRPDQQRKGIGHALIVEGLSRLQALDANGCVLLGDPAYYGRFGFVADPALFYPGVPPEYFQRLYFDGSAPTGAVTYHAAFSAS